MGLVVETSAGRNVGQRGPVRYAKQSVRDLKAHHPARHLGRQAELTSESLTQVPPAPADLPGQRGYADRAVSGAQPPPRPLEFR
jgi:hypothetical protein